MPSPLLIWLSATSWSGILGSLLWVAALAETVRPAFAGETEGGSHRWRWRILIVGAFLSLRWTMWVEPQEHSVDESQSLAGALTLWTDPVFWRSVDGATAGPLHYYMLMPAALFHGHHAYFVARLIGHVLLLGTFFLGGRMLARAVHPAVERAAVFFAVSAFALSRTLDSHHTSTEVLPTFLLTLAAACITRPKQSRAFAWVAGLCLGMIPWAKLQAAPIALGLGLWAVVLKWREKGRAELAALVLAALLPTVLIAAGLTATGLWSDMITPYLLKNAAYPAESVNESDEWTWSRFLAHLFEDGFAGIWLAAGCVLLLVARAVPVAASPPLRRLILFSNAWLLLALLAVAATRRPFFHYWHLVSAPWLLAVGIAVEQGRLTFAVAGENRIRTGLACASMLALAVVPMAAYRLAVPRRSAPMHDVYTIWHAQNLELASLVRPYLVPNDRMAVWGWRSVLYLELGLAQATRQAHAEAQLRKGPWQPYFLRTFWMDFQEHRPVVFVDAVGPDNFGFSDRDRAHESFRQLAEAVRRDYTFIADRYGVRLYIRNDRLAERDKRAPFAAAANRENTGPYP